MSFIEYWFGFCLDSGDGSLEVLLISVSAIVVLMLYVRTFCFRKALSRELGE